jgi:hypothetical protein
MRREGEGMGRWWRVFGASEEQPRPESVLEHLHGLGVTGGRFKGDDQGWTSLEFVPAEGASPLLLECYLSGEEGIRGELNNWAAWLETCDHEPGHAALMERVIQTRQLYTLRRPPDHADEARLDRVGESLCRFLAGRTAGVYQVDGEGFFAADGTLLLREY